MPDITMCSGKDCPVKEMCYRHTATPNEFRQSYFLSPPGVLKDGKFKCDMYWGESAQAQYDQLKSIVKGE